MVNHPQNTGNCAHRLNENDIENVLFVSTHLFEEGPDSFYPGTGLEKGGQSLIKSSCFKDIFCFLDNTRPGTANAHPGGILNIPLTGNTSSDVWRESKFL